MEQEHTTINPRLKKDLEPEEMLRVIFDYAAKIANERTLDKVLMLMADMGREMIVSDRCTVWLLDTQKNELWSKVAHGLDEIRIPSSAGLVGYAVTNDQAVFIHDAYTNEEYKSYLQNGALRTDQQTGYRTKALMVIPFRNSQGEIMGLTKLLISLPQPSNFLIKIWSI
ncbi:GAF domain-containing protein [Paenibacillus roseipurpureus]|uniref:GAF domain-containing protein n=1 Tax=Paenibacillus roseopurpureus TaxID=2918901 RepID=A0AA96LLB9_9BACL|nr:GAF domain-containing protein [Paenibacillus sp. MBLB1832]WNR43216.1 GAF domain-containing protein [Paenibacillus sp. MBLB1832]